MKKLPEVIDLFSGCGGFALGFHKNDFQITYGIDFNKASIDTVSYNLNWRYGMESNHICEDITSFNPSRFSNKIGEEGCIVIGGPPCQAYSKAGQAKLRSLGSAREPINDPRGYLYKNFAEIALKLKAKLIIMENVPASTTYGEENIPEKVSEIFTKVGYDAFWTILNAADYGVPQLRERIFVFAVKKDLKIKVEIPQPTHYGIGRRKNPTTSFSRFSNSHFFRKPPVNNSLQRWITVNEAFSDLPIIFPNLGQRYSQLPMNQRLNYRSKSVNTFQSNMRTWFNSDNQTVIANSFRKTTRDFQIFDRMKPGDNYEQASLLADEIFKEHLRATGRVSTSKESTLDSIRKNIVPPYSRDKFQTRWKRLNPTRPSHTVVAHLSVDTYTHIHPWEPRGITVRVAARLQSFPDDFIFHGNMGDAYKQIGNAIPPMLSYNIAKSIKFSFLKGGSEND